MYRVVIPFLLIISSVIIYFMFISPGFDRMEVSRLERNVLDDALEKRDQLDGILANLEEVRSSITDEDLDKIARVLPAEDDFNAADFVNDINNIALSRELVLESAKFGYVSSDPKDKSPFRELFVDFKVRSEYPTFVEFLKDLEKSERIMNITYSSITVGVEKQYEFNVKLSTQILKES